MEHTITQSKILEIGKKEFLAKGFKDASLRGIVKEAGFTQGAFYGYYSDKAALFEAIVAPVCDSLLEQFEQAQEEHFDLIPTNQSSNAMDLSKQYLLHFINYMYDNFDIFKLVICKSEGTKYETFTHDLVELDIKRSREFFATLKSMNKMEGEVSEELHHVITSAYFTSIFEMVVHDMSRENALTLASGISAFFENGWHGILKYL